MRHDELKTSGVFESSPVLSVSFLDTGEYFNHIYIQYYNNFCWPGDPKWFNSTLTHWLTFAKMTGALVFLGLPAGIHASISPRYYIPPDQLEPLYKVSVLGSGTRGEGHPGWGIPGLGVLGVGATRGGVLG